ncbi:hypothetical protein DH09_11820 [Bacillaceae bacterium JMAK1]|nr:hypothetical protein DH09_11820 [Bacillaceae bacterium JMAK1]
MDAAIITISSQIMTLKIYESKTRVVDETLQFRVSIGHDIYHAGLIEVTTLKEMCRGLEGFRLKLEEFVIEGALVFATASIREAENALYVKDYVYNRTGFSWYWLDNAEERQYHQLAVAEHVPNYQERLKEGALLVDIGSGSIQLTMYQREELVFSQHVKLGPLRIQEVVTRMENQIDRHQDLIEDYILSKIESLQPTIESTKELKHLIVFGTDLKVFNQLFQAYDQLTVHHFHEVYTQLHEKEPRAFATEFQVSRVEYLQLLPSVIILKLMLQWTNASQLHRSESDLCDGLIAAQNERALLAFEQDLMTAVWRIAERFQCSKLNNDAVLLYATRVFDQTGDIHNLSNRERLLLQVACILRNIGNLVSMNHHYLHSYYLINEMEVIGLSNREKQIIAHCVRYHSSLTPLTDTLHFQYLSEQQAVIIAKLTAILRIADALDDSRQQKISRVNVTIEKQNVHLDLYSNDEITLESWVLANKASYFECVFGMNFTFKEIRSNALA